MLSGKDKSGLACDNIENMVQAAIDSFSFCLKLRIALGKALIWDIGKNARHNLSLSSSQSLFILPTTLAYHCFASLVREKGNNFHIRISCVMPGMLRHEHIPQNLTGG
jgi:hypothetical protein